MSVKEKKTLGASGPRARRFECSEYLQVSSCTLGGSFSYRLSTENVSESGLLMKWSKSTKIPFLENTIIEMTIDPDKHHMKSSVKCLGKVVRKIEKEFDSEEGPNSFYEFGIRIVQIEQKEFEKWQECVEKISTDYSSEAHTRVATNKEILGKANQLSEKVA